MELYRKYSSEQWGRWISELGDEGYYGWTKKEWSDWHLQMAEWSECIPGQMAEKRRREERKAACVVANFVAKLALGGPAATAIIAGLVARRGRGVNARGTSTSRRAQSGKKSPSPLSPRHHQLMIMMSRALQSTLETSTSMGLP